MTGNGVPDPSKSATSNAYQHWHLHHYHDVKNVNQVDQAALKRDRTKFGPFGPLVHKFEGTSEVDGQLSSTAKGLKQGLTMRSAPAAAGAFYPGIPHGTLYDSVTNGVSPDQVGQVSDTWVSIGNGLTNLQDTVAKGIASSEVTWQGNSGDKARQSIATLGNNAGQAGQASQLAGVLSGQQSEALQNAKNSVPKPPNPAFDPQSAQAHLQTITNPVAYAAQAAKDVATAQVQKEAHQQAAHIVQQYDHTVAQTSANMPAFAPAPPKAKTPPPPTSQPISSPGGPGGPPGGGSPVQSPVSGGPIVRTPTGPTGPGNGGRPVTGTPVQIDPHNPLPQPSGPPGTTTTQGFNPPPMTTGPGGPSTLPPGSGGTAGGLGGAGGVSGAGGGMFGGPMGGMAGLGGGGGASGGFGAGGARSGIGAGGLGAGSESSAGGSRSGIGAGSAAAEEAAMAEGGAGGGRGGAGGGMPMGAGGRGGRGGDDGEHRRPSWLLETDEGIFGTDERTAPPVIGE
ncbi:MAG TPA: hypothetical protein VGG05_27425 [Pseudonocardiaceae bacterium]